jgi:hypothetical protein
VQNVCSRDLIDGYSDTNGLGIGKQLMTLPVVLSAFTPYHRSNWPAKGTPNQALHQTRRHALVLGCVQVTDCRRAGELGRSAAEGGSMHEAYALAQRAMADLKAAVYMLLKTGPAGGLRNADIGRALGIYAGHIEHEGHIPRTLLALMEKEGVVQQDHQSKRWTICQHSSAPGEEA